MSVKKLITLAAASIASIGVTSAVVAGGPNYVPAPSYAGVYVEGNMGYGYHPWQSDITTVPGILKNFALISSSSRGDGGFIFGDSLGYQFNQHFTLEGGWFYLPKAKFTTVYPEAFTIKSGIAYAAFKVIAPVYENTYVFGKLGVSYTYNQSRHIALESSEITNVVNDVSVNVNNVTSRSNYWNPLFTAGVQYYFTPNWTVNAQYAFVPGYRSMSSNSFVTPVTHLFTVGVGYKFLI